MQGAEEFSLFWIIEVQEQGAELLSNSDTLQNGFPELLAL